MPQMFKYCGQRFQVYKRAHKTCDTVNPVAGRRLADGIHLNLRCDGKAYGGCQAACLIFWKAAWLKQPVDVSEDLRDFSPRNQIFGRRTTGRCESLRRSGCLERYVGL